MGQLHNVAQRRTHTPMVAEYVNNFVQCSLDDSYNSVFQWLCNVVYAPPVTANHFYTFSDTYHDPGSSITDTPVCNSTETGSSSYGCYHTPCNFLPCKYLLMHELYRQYITGYYRRRTNRWRRKLKNYILNGCPSFKTNTCVYRNFIFLRDIGGLCLAIFIAESG